MIKVNGFEVQVMHGLQAFPGQSINYGHVFSGLDWDDVVLFGGFVPGRRIVLTNILNNRLSLMSFMGDGRELTTEKVPHTVLHFDQPKHIFDNGKYT